MTCLDSRSVSLPQRAIAECCMSLCKILVIRKMRFFSRTFRLMLLTTVISRKKILAPRLVGPRGSGRGNPFPEIFPTPTERRFGGGVVGVEPIHPVPSFPPTCCKGRGPAPLYKFPQTACKNRCSTCSAGVCFLQLPSISKLNCERKASRLSSNTLSNPVGRH